MRDAGADGGIDEILGFVMTGFEVSDKGCCGTGTVEVAFLCKYTCMNVSEYVFWDSFHLTEKAYRLLVHQIFTTSIKRWE